MSKPEETSHFPELAAKYRSNAAYEAVGAFIGTALSGVFASRSWEAFSEQSENTGAFQAALSVGLVIVTGRLTYDSYQDIKRYLKYDHLSKGGQ